MAVQFCLRTGSQYAFAIVNIRDYYEPSIFGPKKS